MKYTVISADPGTKNFAFAVTEHQLVKGKLRSKIIATGMVEQTITTMGDGLLEEMRVFEQTLIAMREKYKPDHVFFERFQSRGLKGTTIECINVMLGIMVRTFRKEEPKLLLASTWKNRINKRVDLKATYKDYKLTSKKSPKTQHELDATLIGFYGVTRLLGMSDFENFTESNWDSFINWFLTRPNL